MLRRLVIAAMVATVLGAPVALARPAAAAEPVFTWTGLDAALGNPNWSSGANWAGGVAPPSGLPIDVVVQGPCSGVNCSRSTNDIDGIVVDDFTVAGGSLRVSAFFAGSFTLAGDIAVTDGGFLSVGGLTMTGSTTNWTVDDAFLAVGASGGTHVAVSLANGATFTPGVTAISVSITGADPSAAPATNGLVNLEGNHSPTLLSHVAAAATEGFQNGPLLTDDATMHLGIAISFQGHTGANLNVNGDVALDPGTTIIEDTRFIDRSGPPFPGASEFVASHIAATGSLALNSAALSLDLGGTCLPLSWTTTVAAAAPGGLSGTFANGPEGAVVTGANAKASCLGKYLKIHYDYAAGTATATVVAAPTTTVSTSHTPTVPDLAITYTATVTPAPADGTVTFSDNGSPIVECEARPVSAPTGQATCTTSYGAPGNHVIRATYNGSATVPPSAPSPAVTQVVVPAPTATITSPSGTSTVGTPIEGTASDVGGPGLLGVVLYFHSYTGGPSGAVVVDCDTCGPGQISSTWSFTPPPGSIPGIYSFVVQPYDVAFNPGPPSNVIYQLIL